MAELTWTAEAERWLRDIYDYIALDNPSAAARTIETIYLTENRNPSKVSRIRIPLLAEARSTHPHPASS